MPPKNATNEINAKDFLSEVLQQEKVEENSEEKEGIIINSTYKTGLTIFTIQYFLMK